MLGTTEIILIVLAVFLLFGASRLPKLAKSLGESRRAFKEGMDQAEKEFKMEEDSKLLSSEEKPAVSELSDEDLASELRRRQMNQS